MTKFLLTLHVLAAVVTVGPVTVAASMFPPSARRALAAPGDARALATVLTLHRICRVYAVVAVAVPVFGLATANTMHVLGSPWLVTSIALTVAAAGVLAAVMLPRQSSLLAALGDEGRVQEPAAVARAAGRLAMYTGMFNLLWATVTVLMIVRPGSTTGA
ncbi:DUF2269 family protein [Streptomyces sp. SCA3-4]|uniref:DUF2269 family protein n=1 Tax=Streptomyces sichuanensis TaxID=2871810 RepID=UPI001CE3B43B|nr:DUF2269 family protein [Streptomyces sichuanensis]MCA6091990.1 DUF2269 family protein [Streptomyces sichuanensis]